MSSLIATYLSVMSGSAEATVLTFDVAPPISNFENIDQRYGDLVFRQAMPFNFHYGENGEGFTERCDVQYGPVNADPALVTTGYGDLTNALIKDADSVAMLQVTLTNFRFGEVVNLHSFDIAASTSAFTSDPVINSVRVMGTSSPIPYLSLSNVSISRTTHTSFDFSASPFTDFQLIIELNLGNLGDLSDEIAIDNIVFSQNPEPTTATMVLIAAILVQLMTRRPKPIASHFR